VTPRSASLIGAPTSGGRVRAATQVGHGVRQSDGVERVRLLIHDHPLSAVVVVAAAAALIEVELGLGVLAGLGTVVLLASERGASTRQLLALGGRRALSSTRGLYEKRRGLIGKSRIVSLA